jgi:hypothetical protein
MRVDRRAEGARRERVLDEAEPPARALALDHESDAEGEEMHDLALGWAELPANRCLHRPLLSPYAALGE